jgi:hypothetical protein
MEQPNTENPPPVSTIESEAAQTAVIAADAAITLANTQAALVNAEAAQVVTEALAEIDEIENKQENTEREISWLTNQLQETQATLQNLLTELPKMVAVILTELSPPKASQETLTPEVMTDTQETVTESLSSMPMAAPVNAVDASPVEAMEELAERVEAKIKRLKLI